MCRQWRESTQAAGRVRVGEWGKSWEFGDGGNLYISVSRSHNIPNAGTVTSCCLRQHTKSNKQSNKQTLFKNIHTVCMHACQPDKVLTEPADAAAPVLALVLVLVLVLDAAEGGAISSTVSIINYIAYIAHIKKNITPNTCCYLRLSLLAPVLTSATPKSNPRAKRKQRQNIPSAAYMCTCSGRRGQAHSSTQNKTQILNAKTTKMCTKWSAKNQKVCRTPFYCRDSISSWQMGQKQSLTNTDIRRRSIPRARRVGRVCIGDWVMRRERKRKRRRSHDICNVIMSQKNKNKNKKMCTLHCYTFIFQCLVLCHFGAYSKKKTQPPNFLSVVLLFLCPTANTTKIWKTILIMHG